MRHSAERSPQRTAEGARARLFDLRLWFGAGLGAAVLLPLFCTAIPPLVDYPNHLARLWILVHRAEIPELAANYIVHWRVLPDLAMDLVIPALAHVMPLPEAGRVFTGVTMLGLVGGTATLHRALYGRWSAWPLWSALFVYNAVLFWGFLSCLFATAAYLFAFSGWIATRGWRPALRLPIFAAVAAGLFLLHVFGFGLYGLSVAAYEFGQRWKGRRLALNSLLSYALVCLHFIPGLLLWYLSIGNVISVYTEYGGVIPKLYALLAPTTFGAVPSPLDFVAWLFAGSIASCAIARGAVKPASGMGWPLCAMLAVAAAMPNWANGSWGADIRLPAILPFVIIAATRIDYERRGLVRAVGVVALVLFAVRVASVVQSWQDYGAEFSEFRRASAVISPGARVLPVEALRTEYPPLAGVPAFAATLQPPLFWHMGALAVIDRSALFPYLFTGATTVDVTPQNRAASETKGVPITPDMLKESADPTRASSLNIGPDINGELPYWRDWSQKFDYVLSIDFGQPFEAPSDLLSPVASGSFFTIYRIAQR